MVAIIYSKVLGRQGSKANRTVELSAFPIKVIEGNEPRIERVFVLSRNVISVKQTVGLVKVSLEAIQSLPFLHIVSPGFLDGNVNGMTNLQRNFTFSKLISDGQGVRNSPIRLPFNSRIKFKLVRQGLMQGLGG